MHDIFNLPNDIIAIPARLGDSLIIHHYAAPSGSFRGKSILHMNAISLVISGKKNMHFANKTVTISDDEFHFLSVGNCIVTMELHEAQSFESILIFFDNAMLAGFYSKYDQKIKAIRKEHKITDESYVAFRKDDVVRNFITSLKILIQSKTEVSHEMKLLKFEELMLHLLETYPRQLLSFPLSKNSDLDDLEIRKAMETNFTRNISVEELAFLCNMSLSTFKRRFAKLYDTTPNKWLLQKRMELAKTFIRVHGERPGEVYHKVGYENHSSFTHAFKQFFGMTPSEFYSGEVNRHQQVLDEMP